ncbi:hypothetical protein C6Q12_17365 [Burkholderia multivorans]|uniref:hypothetical protein n=1 Tax=Burkholderia multivorans TaxID=87883 RepID=UPI000CFF9F0E|nr:hypothetical protein [Burkholderia multivorans]PRF75080.1 hypothetical protein C6Q12_17365 [Burkholderia multivorans]
MQTETFSEYRSCAIRTVVMTEEDGRYTAAAIVADRDGETRTLGVEGNFAESDEARDRAMELAIAWIQQRSIVSERCVRHA